MKKMIVFIICILLFSSNVFAYNPNSFTDEESITVDGKRPQIDIEVSELTINILPDDFDETGIAEKNISISNIGNTSCVLILEVQNVPIDLIVNATVDTDILFQDETTNLNISVELTEQQETDSFTFTILVIAEK